MRVVGVIGTMVWDTIWRPEDRDSPTEEWGGISYALAAADASDPIELRVRPLVKLGRDLAERGLRFLKELRAIETCETVSVVEAMNPRVELRYTGDARRTERLVGGVPSWSWSELAPRLASCEALYINFITGDELDLDVAKRLRREFHGTIYADIHSLMLGTGEKGLRHRRPLERWSEWLACFDIVQLNEDELKAMASHWGDPWAFAAAVVGRQTRLLLVTLGPGGAAYVMTPDAVPLRVDERAHLERRTSVHTGRVPVGAVKNGDPTGCGDVWGMTAFRGLLAGRDIERVMRHANEMAGRNVAHRGATGLNRFLRGEIARDR